MRDPKLWAPTKFIRDATSGTWVPNPQHVAITSRLVASLQIATYIEFLRRYAKGRLLDCGCGEVPYYGIYGQLVSDSVCIDWENTSHSQRHVDQTVDLNGPLPFAAGSFDTVLLSDVLEHIAEPDFLIQEISRVLRPQGCLLLMVPFLYYIHEAPFDFHRYTEFALRRLCDRASLTVLELAPYGGYADVLLDLINKASIKTERMARLYLTLCRWIQRSKRYQRIRASSSRSFPLGYCLAAQKPPVRLPVNQR
jgi:SAM-dependent methyltransferase